MNLHQSGILQTKPHPATQPDTPPEPPQLGLFVPITKLVGVHPIIGALQHSHPIKFPLLRYSFDLNDALRFPKLEPNEVTIPPGLKYHNAINAITSNATHPICIRIFYLLPEKEKPHKNNNYYQRPSDMKFHFFLNPFAREESGRRQRQQLKSMLNRKSPPARRLLLDLFQPPR